MSGGAPAGRVSPVLVVGLAKTGAETTAVLRREGVEVTVVEEHAAGPEHERRADDARASGATVLEGAPSAGWEQLVGAFSLIVPSPGLRPDHPALERDRTTWRFGARSSSPRNASTHPSSRSPAPTARRRSPR